MNPTKEDDGTIWLFKHAVFGLSAAKLEFDGTVLWCWMIGCEKPRLASSREFKWLGPAATGHVGAAGKGEKLYG